MHWGSFLLGILATIGLAILGWIGAFIWGLFDWRRWGAP